MLAHNLCNMAMQFFKEKLTYSTIILQATDGRARFRKGELCSELSTVLIGRCIE
jgi:hypothetical protein